MSYETQLTILAEKKETLLLPVPLKLAHRTFAISIEPSV